MIPDFPHHPTRFNCIQNHAKASLLILFVTGSLVCSTAYAKEHIRQMPSKVAVTTAALTLQESQVSSSYFPQVNTLPAPVSIGHKPSKVAVTALSEPSSLRITEIMQESQGTQALREQVLPPREPRLVEPEDVSINIQDNEVSVVQGKSDFLKDISAPAAVNGQDSRVWSYHVPRYGEVIRRLDELKVPPPLPNTDAKNAPVYVSGDHIEGDIESNVWVLGRGQLIRNLTVLQGDKLTYNRQTEVTTATDNVHLNNEGNIFNGTYAELHVPSQLGFFDKADYKIALTGAHGTSSKIEFTGQRKMTVNDAVYTLCEPKLNGKYDWVLTAESVDLDFEKDEGIAHNAVMRFMNVPILATPWMSFPLSDKRRSGFLVPSFDVNNDSGFTYEQPYYWNIAPNYDATLTPFYMTKRGVGMNVEFRYLQPSLDGVFTGIFLPNDRLRDKEDRWAYSLLHHQTIAQNVGFFGDFKLNLELNRASDDYYWQDFPHSIGEISDRSLNNEGILTSYNNGFSTLFRVQRKQTLQEEGDYIDPPFNRYQFNARYEKEDIHGFDFSLMTDITKFEAGDDTHSHEDGTRGVFSASLSYPFREPGWFFIPKVQLMNRYYAFENDITYKRWHDFNTGKDVYGTLKSRSITVPSFSLDTGLIFERKANIVGRDYVQTLEPRVHYVYSPYRNQSMLPLYDTAEYDVNLATIYLDNPYEGYDRMADVNMMTVGLGTRWLNPKTGAQALSLNVAQRIRFEDQKVTLDNLPITSRYSDVLLSASTELIPQWRFDALVQYDTHENRSQRSILMARWKPGRYRVMNLSYRMTHGLSEQVDFSWQWPLGSPWIGPELPTPSKSGGRWFSVGRANYSLRDRRLIDGVLGFEYQGCCWIGRLVFEQLSTGIKKTNQRIAFQLEFAGLSRVGMNPLQRLRENIDNYETIQTERRVRRSNFNLYD